MSLSQQRLVLDANVIVSSVLSGWFQSGKRKAQATPTVKLIIQSAYANFGSARQTRPYHQRHQYRLDMS
jgi:hypothetical protein